MTSNDLFSTYAFSHMLNMSLSLSLTHSLSLSHSLSLCHTTVITLCSQTDNGRVNAVLNRMLRHIFVFETMDEALNFRDSGAHFRTLFTL